MPSGYAVGGDKCMNFNDPKIEEYYFKRFSFISNVINHEQAKADDLWVIRNMIMVT